MAKHELEFEAACAACDETGLYVGMGERDGSAVVCSTCKGTGKTTLTLEYKDFTGRKKRKKVKRVVEANPGICIGDGPNLTIKDFGGISYAAWLKGKKFPPGSEMRKFTCPAWWYQSTDYDKKPDWDECIGAGSFSSCSSFKNKAECWKRWDKENGR